MRGRIISAVLTLPRWQVQDTSGAVLWVTRITRLFRFVDDLYILVEPRDGGSAVLVRSASRIGQGDLGQNRRNIIELWAALARAIPKLPTRSSSAERETVSSRTKAADMLASVKMKPM